MPDNVETIRRGYEAWNRGDLDSLAAIYAPDVTADAGVLWPSAGEIAGPQAIIDAYASIIAIFEESEVLADEYIERGDCVVVPTRWRGLLPGSEDVVEQKVVATYTMRDGQVVHIGYFTRLEDAFELTAASRRRSPRARARPRARSPCGPRRRCRSTGPRSRARRRCRGC